MDVRASQKLSVRSDGLCIARVITLVRRRRSDPCILRQQNLRNMVVIPVQPFKNRFAVRHIMKQV